MREQGRTEVLAIRPLIKAQRVNVVIQEEANALLNPVSASAESLTPLDNRHWLMVLCQEL
jgi:hypothetical protein